MVSPEKVVTVFRSVYTLLDNSSPSLRPDVKEAVWPMRLGVVHRGPEWERLNAIRQNEPWSYGVRASKACLRRSWLTYLIRRAIAVGWLAGWTATPSLAQVPVAPRPIIIFIHGRALENDSSEAIRAAWVSAFKEGLKNAGSSSLVGDSDLVLVTYQDLYRPGVAAVCPADATYERAALAPKGTAIRVARSRLDSAQRAREKADTTREMAAATMSREHMDTTRGAFELQRQVFIDASSEYQKARVADLVARPELAAAVNDSLVSLSSIRSERRTRDSMYRITHSVSWPDILAELRKRLNQVIAALSRSNLAKLGGTLDFFLDNFARDTKAYLENYELKCATQARLALALEAANRAHRPIILVAHSMGSLVAYDLLKDLNASGPLRLPPRDTIVRFISIGSQLGLQELMKGLYGRLDPPFRIPVGIESWTNFRGVYDPLSPGGVFSGMYKAQTPMGIAEYEIETDPSQPHWVNGYLINPAVVRAVMNAWCRAFAERNRQVDPTLESTVSHECTRFSSDVSFGRDGTMPFRY